MGDPTPADVQAARYVAEFDFGLAVSGYRYTIYAASVETGEGRFIKVYERMKDWDFDIETSHEWMSGEEADRLLERLKAEFASYNAMNAGGI